MPWELLFADDLVLIADTQEECISKLKAWKASIESEGLCVNMNRTKFLVSDDGHDVLKKSDKYPTLSAVVMLATNQYSAYCGSTTSAVASPSGSAHRRQDCDWGGCRRHHA